MRVAVRRWFLAFAGAVIVGSCGVAIGGELILSEFRPFWSAPGQGPLDLEIRGFGIVPGTKVWIGDRACEIGDISEGGSKARCRVQGPLPRGEVRVRGELPDGRKQYGEPKKVFILEAAPRIRSIIPSTVSRYGVTPLVIEGEGFYRGAVRQKILIQPGDHECIGVVVESPRRIRCTAPAVPNATNGRFEIKVAMVDPNDYSSDTRLDVPGAPSMSLESLECPRCERVEEVDVGIIPAPTAFGWREKISLPNAAFPVSSGLPQVLIQWPESEKPLYRQLLDLAKQCKRIKNLAFSTHARPGIMNFGGANELDIERIHKELPEPGVSCVMAKQAEVHLLGCNIARGCMGQHYMSAMARRLLRNGGKIRGPTSYAVGDLGGVTGTNSINFDFQELTLAPELNLPQWDDAPKTPMECAQEADEAVQDRLKLVARINDCAKRNIRISSETAAKLILDVNNIELMGASAELARFDGSNRIQMTSASYDAAILRYNNAMAKYQETQRKTYEIIDGCYCIPGVLDLLFGSDCGC